MYDDSHALITGAFDPDEGISGDFELWSPTGSNESECLFGHVVSRASSIHSQAIDIIHIRHNT
jgi:hypothetical protein